jgi:sRNA-binding carbon storage regulator CsrA
MLVLVVKKDEDLVINVSGIGPILLRIDYEKSTRNNTRIIIDAPREVKFTRIEKYEEKGNGS